MDRYKEIVRRTTLKARKRLNPINRKRKAERFERAFGPKAAWISRRPCLVCGSVPCEAAHVKSRGAGGTSADLIPLCTLHHREQHDTGIRTFAARHHLDLAWIADLYEKRWQKEEAA